MHGVDRVDRIDKINIILMHYSFHRYTMVSPKA